METKEHYITHILIPNGKNLEKVEVDDHDFIV